GLASRFIVPGMMPMRRLPCGNHSGLIAKPFRDRAKTFRLPAGITVRLQPGTPFVFTPERFHDHFALIQHRAPTPLAATTGAHQLLDCRASAGSKASGSSPVRQFHAGKLDSEAIPAVSSVRCLANHRV